MSPRLFKNEAGYSLVEVMVAIMILTIAIIPMVSMFDVGLNAATQGGKYDKARTLANRKLEQAKSLTYAQVRDNFPQAGNSTPYTSSYLSFTDPELAGFEYKVEKQYLEAPPIAPSSPSLPFKTISSDQGMIRVTVTVRWDNTKTYSTSAVVAKEGS